MVQSSSFAHEVQTSCVNAVCDCRERSQVLRLAIHCRVLLSLPRASLVRYHSTHGDPQLIEPCVYTAQGAPQQLEISKWPFAKVSACGRTRGTRAIVHPCARSWVQPNGRRLALCDQSCHRQGCSSSLCASFAADSACTQLRQAHRLCWRAADAESCPELPLPNECVADPSAF